MHSAISASPLNGWEALAEYSKPHARCCGAAVSFVGVMRDSNNSRAVSKMFLEHYPGMTEGALHALAAEAVDKNGIDDVLLLHRVGNVHPGDELVVIGVWSPHRAAAFEACEWLIEQLKHRIPLWKKEFGPDGAAWVAANTLGRCGTPLGHDKDKQENE